MAIPEGDEADDVLGTVETGATGAAAPAEVVPDNYSNLADLAREIEPSLKDSETLPNGFGKPEGPTRGADGKFKSTLAADATGATGPEEGATGPVGATGAAEATGASGSAAVTGATGPTARDSDLDVKPDDKSHPRTRKVITEFQQKAIDARNERDAARAEQQKTLAKVTELEERLKGIKAPKEMEDELATLRTRVRELDISKDPKMQQKYDARITKNNESALGLLKDQGLFMVAQKEGAPKEMTEAEKKALTSEIERSGFGIRGMARYISSLEKAGEFEAAENLRQIASENDRLGREKAEEIATWNKDYEGLQATRTREAQAANEATARMAETTAKTKLQQDLMELGKQFPVMLPPAAIQESDSAEVKASKQKALDAYKLGETALNEAVKEFSTEGLTPDKAAVAYGKLQASAIQAIIIRQQLLPRLQKDLETANARIKELETRQGKLDKATTLNRAHSAEIKQPQNNGRAPAADLSLEDAAKQIGKELGINVNS